MKTSLILAFFLFFYLLSSCTNDSAINDETESEKSDKNTPSADTVSPISILEKHQPPIQTFMITGKRDTIIECEKGTKIIFPKNVFVDAGGNSIEGNITISVQEFYEKKDFLSSNLTTTSNGRLLESGGMLDIKAISDEKKLNVKNGKKYIIAFPENGNLNSNNTDFRIFYGNRSSADSTINWVLDDESKDITASLKNTDKAGGCKIEPHGVDCSNCDDKKIGEIIDKTLVLAENTIEYLENFENLCSSTSGITIYASIKINPKDASLISSSGFRKADVEIIKKILDSIPGSLKGAIQSKPIDLKFFGRVHDTKVQNTIIETYGEKYKDLFSRGIPFKGYEASKLGLINCDRFIKEETSPVKVVAKNISRVSMYSYIIFREMNSVMTLAFINNEAIIDIPAGKKVTFLSISYEDGQGLKLANKNFVSSDNMIVNVEYKDSDKEAFEDFINNF